MTEHDDAGNYGISEEQERKIRRRQTIRIAVLVTIGAVLALWAIVNRDDTEVDWLVATTTAPLVVVIVLSAILGFVLGAFVAARRRD